ncbi:hypothetical protein HaGV_gp070 [Helicoverpa armigera granulovirus]|uniref:Uncharacterized protein n=1 Tax=Helicoverpa armigera granulovirus TaxID=489830 RepID=A9YMR2_9BBAC|nr:hypothetical protein HaGV_gp070 [Helicoverpa armigera granulovirus]ABY47761.1 unknown [Helicoverpa armigera granulovirus]
MTDLKIKTLYTHTTVISHGKRPMTSPHRATALRDNTAGINTCAYRDLCSAEKPVRSCAW